MVGNLLDIQALTPQEDDLPALLKHALHILNLVLRNTANKQL